MSIFSANYANDFRRAQALTGATLDDIRDLSEALRVAGAENPLEATTEIIREFTNRVGEAVQDGTGAANEAFKNLRLDPRQLQQGLEEDLQGTVDLVLDTIRDLDSQALRTFNLEEIFGGAGSEFAQLLLSLNDYERGLLFIQRQNRRVVTQADLDLLREQSAQFRLLRSNLQDFALQAGVAIAPTIINFLEQLNVFIRETDFQPLFDALPIFAQEAANLAREFFDWISTLDEEDIRQFARELRALVVAIVSIIEVVRGLLRGLGALGDFFSDNVGEFIEDWNELTDAVDTTRGHIETIVNFLDGLTPGTLFEFDLTLPNIIKEFLEDWNELLDEVNRAVSLFERIVDAFRNLEFPDLSLPNFNFSIPQFQRGVIDYGGGRAVVHSGELILPPGASVLPRGWGGTTTVLQGPLINIEGDLTDSKERELRRLLNRIETDGSFVSNLVRRNTRTNRLQTGRSLAPSRT